MRYDPLQDRVLLASEISGGEGGTDTSDATAEASDLLAGKTAYGPNGKFTGTITALAARTITPGTADQALPAGTYLSGAIIVKGDANLVAANIADGIEIFGVTGELAPSAGGGIEFYKCATVDMANSVWSGYKVVQGQNGSWSAASAVTADLPVSGYFPRVGEIYSNDTTLWIREAYVAQQGKMVMLDHCEVNGAHVDATETCIVNNQNQSGFATTDHYKFGSASFGYNYYNPESPSGGMTIFELPEMDAFTIEWWHYHTGYETRPFTGAIIVMPAVTGKPEASITGYGFDSAAALDRWVHRAFVRQPGSDQVVEYWDGTVVQTHTMDQPLGGRPVWLFGGGVGGDTRDRLDEIAIFNYAKYTGNSYTPPTAAYNDVLSGLRTPNAAREVTVSGIENMTFANDASYALDDPTKTGLTRTWSTSDGKWHIYYDWNYENDWVIANGTDSYEEGYICAAIHLTDWDAVYSDPENNPEPTDDNFNPIGNPDWVDNGNHNIQISVTANV